MSLSPGRLRAHALTFAAAAAFLTVSLLNPSRAMACACGCTNVGISTLLPSAGNGLAYVEWDFVNQTTNWSGNHSAPSGNNDDQKIRTHFVTVGGQYFLNQSWGVRVEVPVLDRQLRTTEEDHPGTFNHTDLGDVRVMGIYSGFSPNKSTGLIFGLKLPTGSHHFPDFDSDVQIGTGSTDAILGAYHHGALSADMLWGYYGQVLWQHELTTQDHYRPGSELNAAVGITYTGLNVGNFNVAPALQLVLHNRTRDGGAIGDPDNTGFTRLLVAPGIAISRNAWTLYAGVEVATFQHVNGNQLIAPVAVKAVASYNF
jgi:hypothetical protein